MKNTKMYLPFVIAGLSAAAFADVQTTNKWVQHAANTPDTAYVWKNGEYWNEKTSPAAGDYVSVYPNSKVYITLSDDIPLQYLIAGDKAYFLGDVKIKSAYVGGTLTRGSFYSSAWHYGDVIFTQDDTQDPYVTGFNLCGWFRNNRTAGSKRITVPSGTCNFHFNRFARTGGEVRTGDLQTVPHFYIGNGTINFHAPGGAEAASGVWRTTEGSPYAYRVSAAVHPLAVGTAVTAGGALPEGTFLKHFFDDATIELSSPATATGEFTLSFAAFTPDFTAEFPTKFVMGGTKVTLCAYRQRAQDRACISFANGFECSSTVASSTIFGGEGKDDLPATFLFGPVSGKWKKYDGAFYLRNTHWAFTDNSSFSADQPVKMPAGDDGAYTARMTLDGGQSITIASLGDFAGMIVKDGEGMLTIGLDDAVSPGSFAVEGGTLKIVKNESAGEAQLTIGSIALSPGARLEIPEDGIRVGSIAACGAAAVSGGKITVLSAKGAPGSDFGSLVFENGASIIQSVSAGAGALALDVGEGEVVGHPAFWLDASASGTLECEVELGTNYVTRWNDCRAGETMYCTNIVDRPTYFNGTKMSEKFVRIARCENVSDHKDTQMLVWSEPLRDIRAVFLVQDPSEGGGVILGRCPWRLSNDDCGSSGGGAYCRVDNIDWKHPLVHWQCSAAAVRDGLFFLNGVEVCGTNTSYLGAFPQLVEHHPNPGLPNAVPVSADAFGGGYENPNSSVAKSNGGMKIYEYIIYTNSLSHAERCKVAQYLSRKWLGKNVYCRASGASATVDVSALAVPGVEIAVPDGEEGAIAAISGGKLLKSGGGKMYAEMLQGTDVRVKEGELVVPSVRNGGMVPRDSFLHVDASAVDTFELDGDTVVKWNDVNGLDKSLVNHGTSVKAKFVQAAMNGRPLVDLGPAGEVIYNKKNSAALKHDGYSAHYTVQTGFAVYDSSAGGSSVFGSVGNAYPGRGLPHDRSNGFVVSESGYATTSWTGIPAMSNAVANASAIFRRNGEIIDPFTVPFLLGPERFSFRYPVGRIVMHFGAYGQSSQFAGGVKLGEIILFDRALSDQEMDCVENYLAKKWFGIDVPGYVSAAGSVAVDPGAVLTVLGDGFSAGALSGGGVVNGDVSLVPGGVIAAELDGEGAVRTLTVNGTLTVGGGTVTVPAGAGSVEPGEYVVVSAAKIVKGEGQWTLPVHPRRNYSLRFSETEARLFVRRNGMFLICR